MYYLIFWHFLFNNYRHRCQDGWGQGEKHTHSHNCDFMYWTEEEENLYSRWPRLTIFEFRNIALRLPLMSFTTYICGAAFVNDDFYLPSIMEKKRYIYIYIKSIPTTFLEWNQYSERNHVAILYVHLMCTCTQLHMGWTERNVYCASL